MIKTIKEISLKTVVEFPLERFEVFEANQEKILAYINDATSKTQQEFLTIPEFMARCKISRWTVNDLREKGKLDVKKIGGKLYIPFSEVNRFFRGELSE